jgi:hypothetical protein
LYSPSASSLRKKAVSIPERTKSESLYHMIALLGQNNALTLRMDQIDLAREKRIP